PPRPGSSMIPQPPRPPLFPYTTALPISIPVGAAEARLNKTRSLVRCVNRRPEFASGYFLRVPLTVPFTTSPFEKRASIAPQTARSEEHTSELQSRGHLVCGLLLEKKKCT